MTQRSTLRFLDPALRDPDALATLAEGLSKMSRVVEAVRGGAHHIADILNDADNRDSLGHVFGEQELPAALELITRLALHGQASKSMTLHQAIEGPQKMGFLDKATAGWKGIRSTIVLSNDEGMAWINPARPGSWKNLGGIAKGTLLGIHVSAQSPAAAEQALAQWQALFAELESGTLDSVKPTPAVRGVAGHSASKPASKAPARPPKAPPKSAPASAWKRPSFGSGSSVSTAGPPVYSLKVIINKMDTFVHAGNAHLIVTHIRDYAGRIKLFVLRGEKKEVQMDADSLWSAEIRNGETVVYEFFGPMPDDAFIKDLAQKTNKYTQMDKVAGE